MNKQTEDQLVLATKIITPILLVSITGGIAFWYIKKQKEIKKTYDEEISKLESDKELLEEKTQQVEEALIEKQEELTDAVFGDIDTSGEVGVPVENAEFAEMRKRYSKEEPEVKEAIVHNVFEENLVSDPNVNDGEVTQKDIDDFEASKKRMVKKAYEVDPMSPDYKKEEDSIKMIHERNSKEAFQAFINWKLIDVDFDDEILADDTVANYGLDFAPGQARDVEMLMRSLFTIPARPSNDYDLNITEICMAQRLEYFGEDSTYVTGAISIGEVLLHWAERLSEDTDGGSIWAYLAQFINNLDLYNASGMTPFEMQERIDLVMEHNYTTPNGTFGIFGLTDEMMQPIIGAEKQFQTQFNAYLGDIIAYNESLV